MNSIGLQATQEVVSVLPRHAVDMKRLCHLLARGEPTVTVVGKYNHGKSMLLNALIGRACFAVADRRETVTLSGRVDGGVRWLDAPGLDADVATMDDRHALDAAWLESDIRLFVHAAKEGELDAAELDLLRKLRADAERTQRQTLFVLSQLDQLPDDDALECVYRTIAGQLRGLEINAVSSTRHQKGLEQNKLLLVERSGIPQLHAELQVALGRVPAARAHEQATLFTDIRTSLGALLDQHQEALRALRMDQSAQRAAFDAGLRSLIGKVGSDIATFLASVRTDNVFVPDTARDAYTVTAGKRQRAVVQMAYSRACIEIDGFLAGRGVAGLPAGQETVARALNTVMIAVLGVSVKFPNDLRRMFCTEAGQRRLQDDFTRYYEICADRKALAARIADTEALVAGVTKAIDGLQALEENA